MVFLVLDTLDLRNVGLDTHPLEQAHLAAAEQTAALVRKAGEAA